MTRASPTPAANPMIAPPATAATTNPHSDPPPDEESPVANHNPMIAAGTNAPMTPRQTVSRQKVTRSVQRKADDVGVRL